MPTDDIIKGDVPAYMNDTLRLFYAELQKGETDYQGMLIRLATIIDAEARADERAKCLHETATIDEPAFRKDERQKIFAKLDKILKRGSKVYDIVENRVYYKLTIKDEKEYSTLKKECKVD